MSDKALGPDRLADMGFRLKGLSNRSRAITKSRAGFTLVEIMVVLAIIGAVLATVAPRLVSRTTQIKGAVRELSTRVRETHNAARLFNATFRLVFTFDDKEGHSLTVESAPGNVTLLSEEQESELEKMSSRTQDAEKKTGGFSEDARVKPLKLPKGLYFGEIEYGNRTEAISEGVAYIHFFPQGLTEEAVIHLTDRKTLNWTIAIHPITGKANLYDGNIPLKELRSQ